MSRKKLIAGNWKMHKTADEADLLTGKIASGLQGDDVCDVWIAPPIIYLQKMIPGFSTFPIKFGAQNCSDKAEGAFTGEISAAMIKSIGCSFVILGHSERRQYFDETNEIIHHKIIQVLEQKMQVILCCGETLEQRNATGHFITVKQQLEEALYEISEDSAGQIIIAYEPVWAIGTGVNASAEEAAEMHDYIRELLTEQYKRTAETMRIIYGGSVKPANAEELFTQPGIDGALIGGASLHAGDFLQITGSCRKSLQ